MILIISRDEDFSSVIAEKIRQELKLETRIVKNPDEGRKLISQEISCIIASEPVSFIQDIPVITVVDGDAPPGARKAPVRISDLLADIRAVQVSSQESMAVGKYRLLPRQKKLERADGENIALTDKEINIFQSLIESGAGGLSKEALLKAVWGYESAMDTHTLETHIYRLRAKLKTLGEEQAIAAEGGGYVLKLKA